MKTAKLSGKLYSKTNYMALEQKFNILLCSFITLVILLIIPSDSVASEGTIELRSTGNEPYRCYAASIRMLEPEYRILFTCKFILYPAEEDVFNYIMWANPIEGTRPVKLGLIGQGRGEFKTRVPFTNLFVTTEVSRDAKTPTGRVVMTGGVNKIMFLEEVQEYEPTPTLSAQEKETSPTPTGIAGSQTGATTRDKILTAFKRAGVAAVVAIIALVGLIFVITRSRG